MKKVFSPTAALSHPSAVFLLNSPDCRAWEYEKYLAYYKALKPSGVYFICADGAYRRLLEYCEQQKLFELQSAPAYCHAIIGDMDSDPSLDDEFVQYCTVTQWAETVEDIEASLLSSIREAKCDSEGRKPYRMPIKCQMTTDFQKCVKLYLLLAGTGEVDRAASSSSGESELDTVIGEYTKSCEVHRQQDDGDDGQGLCLDYQRQIDLLQSAKECRTVELPSVVVLGALGGRLDHEIASFCTLCRHSTELNLVLLNKHNVAVACWPNGMTQWNTNWGSGSEKTEYCGVVPFGTAVSMETSGLQYNVVLGRPTHYDGVTQTSQYDFSFSGLVSTSNVVNSKVVLIDLTPTESGKENPPTILMFSFIGV